MSTFQRGKLSISMCIKRYSSIFKTQSGVKGQSYGHLGIIICTTITLQHTRPWRFAIIWPKTVSVLPQPPYSPDMAPYDFYLFPKLKILMKGQCYNDVDAIKQKTDDELRCISRESFKQCMQEWVKWWDHCISSSGCYFEEDKFDWVDMFSIFCINKSVRELLDQTS